MSFLVNWIFDVLGYLGLYHKNAKLVFLGLDNAGKSTLLHMLKDDRMAQLEPTTHPQSEELLMGNLRLRTFDLGGHEIARKIWRDYLGFVDGIIFLVDSSDRERLPLARDELHGLLSMPELEATPFVILGNKIDIDYAASEDELRDALSLPPKELRPIQLFMCSVAKRTGYAEGFRWLSQYIK